MATKSAAYSKRTAPKAYDAGFMDEEFGNIQRAVQQTVVRTITASAKQQVSDAVVFVDCTGGAVTFTLLTPGLAGPFLLTVKKTDASGNAVTISGTVDGAVNPTLAAQYKSMTILSDGVKWWKVCAI